MTNYCLQNEQTVSGLRKIVSASVLSIETAAYSIQIYRYIYLYIYIYKDMLPFQFIYNVEGGATRGTTALVLFIHSVNVIHIGGRLTR